MIAINRLPRGDEAGKLNTIDDAMMPGFDQVIDELHHVTLGVGSWHLGLRSNHADANRLAFAFRVLQSCLLRLCFRLERFRQGCKLTADVLEKQPPINDSGHESL